MQKALITRSLLTATLAAALLASGCASKVPLNKDSGTGDNAAVDNSRQITPVDTAGAGSSASENMSQAELAARTVYFDFDSYIVKPEFETLLQKNAAFIKADKNRQVKLEGHADLRGTREYNLALGQKRADAVKQALSLLGVPEGQMEAVSFGKEKPVTEDLSEEAQAKNRRVELAYP
jgi:peptidoglycan-associated lipoprotein